MIGRRKKKREQAARWALAMELIDYADHDSWRCGHPDRYPWIDGDCICGLTELQRRLGVPVALPPLPPGGPSSTAEGLAYVRASAWGWTREAHRAGRMVPGASSPLPAGD